MTSMLTNQYYGLAVEVRYYSSVVLFWVLVIACYIGYYLSAEFVGYYSLPPAGKVASIGLVYLRHNVHSSCRNSVTALVEGSHGVT